MSNIISNSIECLKESEFKNHELVMSLTNIVDGTDELLADYIPVIGGIFKLWKARQLKKDIALTKKDIERLKSRYVKHSQMLNKIQDDLSIVYTNISELHNRVLRVEIMLTFFVPVCIFSFGILNKKISQVEKTVNDTNKPLIIPPIKQNLEVGMESNDVRAIERFLETAGYDPGKVDGKFDKDTLKAVIRLQDHLSIEKDGIIGPNTIKEIRKKYEKQ